MRNSFPQIIVIFLLTALASRSGAQEVKGLSLSPSATWGGYSSTGTVTLSKVAPSAGVLVSLSSSTVCAQVPKSVKVPSGSTSVNFLITTTLPTRNTPVVIKATSGSSSSTAPLTVYIPGIANSSWAKFRSNANCTGKSFGLGASGYLGWMLPVGSRLASSTAVGADGTVYITGDEGANDSIEYYLYAISPAGGEKWKYYIGGQGFNNSAAWSSPTVGADGTVYVGSDTHSLYAISPDGLLKWVFVTGNGIDSSPAIGADGTIYVGSGDTYLYAINPNGTLKWKFATFNYIAASPAVDASGTVYIGSADGFFYAINPNGTLKWKFPKAGYFSSPAIGPDGAVYVGGDDDNLYAINPDGTPRWQYDVGNGNGTISSPAIGADGTVYIGSNDDSFYAINPSGSLKWQFPTGGIIESSPAISADGTVYFGSQDGYIYAMYPNGTLKWKFATGKSVFCSPAIGADGTIYTRSTDGWLYALTTKPPAVKGLTLNPSVVIAGYPSTATLTLSEAAPASGVIVSLSSNNSAAAVPTAVQVGSGKTTATFTVNTVGAGVASVAASTSGGASSATLVIQPPAVKTMSLKPSVVFGGSPSTATLTLSQPAPADGVTVSLSSSNSAATVPATIQVAGGKTTAVFIVNTVRVPNTTTVSIKASTSGGASSAVLTIKGLLH